MHIHLLLAGNCALTANQIDTYRQQFPVDSVIAVDGGIQYAAQLGLQPDIWLGDFDSARAEDLTQYASVAQQRFPTDKDQLDTELALAHAATLDAGAQVVLWSAFGGRADHQLAIQLLPLQWPNFRFILPHASCCFYSLSPNAPLELPLRPQQSFSILPLRNLQGLCIRHARWELDQAQILAGSGHGMSNLAAGDQPLTLRCSSGLAWVIVNSGL